jgi:hypothetical protein
MLVPELKQVIRGAWARVRKSREPWKLARPIASELAPVLTALDRMIDRGDAAAAEEVLHQFIKAADKDIGDVDDSHGHLWPLCQEAVTLWGKAWGKITSRDTAQLAVLVFEGVHDNGYAIRDHMIRDFAQALGRDGLQSLKSLLLAQHEANVANDTREDWKRNEPLRHLEDVADAMGDVDMYIDIKRRCGLEGIYATPIARRLLDAGRAPEAMEYLNRADPTRSHASGEHDDFTTLRFKVLRALGRDDEARATLWQAFRSNLNGTALDQVLAMTPDEKRSSLMDEAYAAAEVYPNRLAAAKFLVERGQGVLASKLIDTRPEEYDGRYYDSLLELARSLQDKFPASAWTLYRALLLSILDEKRSKAYHHAAEYLAIARDLAERAHLNER